MDTDRTIEILVIGGSVDDSATTLSVDTWYRIEITFTKGTGSDATCTLWVDGTQEANSTGGSGTVDADQGRYESTGAGLTHWDDILNRNDATLPGAGQIEAIRPNDAGDEADSDWDDTIDGAGTACPTSTGTGCSDQVDDQPLNESTGVEARSDPSGDLLLDSTTISSVGTINFFRLSSRMERGSGGATTHALRVKVGASTAEDSSDISLSVSTTYEFFDPPTSPSSQADLDATQIGAHHDGAQDYRVFELWGMVDYTPAAAPTLTQAPFINFPLVY